MAEIDAALYSPSRQPEQDAYLAACSALLLVIITGKRLTEQHRSVLLEAMPDEDMRHRLSYGLIFHELIATTDNQAPR